MLGLLISIGLFFFWWVSILIVVLILWVWLMMGLSLLLWVSFVRLWLNWLRLGVFDGVLMWFFLVFLLIIFVIC